MAYYKFCFEKQSSAQTIVRSRRGGERLLKLQQPLSSNSIFAAGGKILQGGGARAKASFFYFSSFVKLNRVLSGSPGSSVPPRLILPPRVTEVHTRARLRDEKRPRLSALQRETLCRCPPPPGRHRVRAELGATGRQPRQRGPAEPPTAGKPPRQASPQGMSPGHVPAAGAPIAAAHRLPGAVLAQGRATRV